MKKLIGKVKFPLDTLAVNPFNIQEPKHYRFLTDLDDLQEGDTVVVDTVNGLKIANFVEYSNEHQEFGETFSNKKPRWIIQAVDIKVHEARLAAAAQIEVLKKQMEIRRKKAQEMEIYEILAKADPEMAKLVEEFKTLQEVL